MKKVIQGMLLLIAICSADAIELPGEAEFNAFHSNSTAFAQALAAQDTAAVSNLLPELILLDSQMSPRLIRIGQRAEAIVKPSNFPDGFDVVDFSRMLTAAESANLYRSRSLYLTKLWLNNDDLSFATNATAFFTMSLAADERMARLFGVLLAGPLTNAAPPFLYVTANTGDSIPAEEDSAIKIRVENVGDDTAEAVMVDYSTNSQLGPKGTTVIGSIPPGHWSEVSLLMNAPNEEVMILLDIEVSSANAETVGFSEWLIAVTNCATGP